MPVVNDIPGAYERIKQQADDLARRLGVQKEVIYGFFNSTAHFPQTIGELEAWGNDPTNNQYNTRRRQPNGVWTPIVPGDTPGTLGAKDPGFRHVITNAEDSDIQRFQQVDPSGNVFGGSWDPAYNRAHPELAGKSGYQTATASLASGGGMRQALTSAAGGGKSLEDMTNELRVAGYPGPWDEASVRAAYQRTARPEDGGSGGGGDTGGPSGSGGYTDLLNQVADTNREKWEFEKLKAQHDMSLADNADQRAEAYQRYLEAQQQINQGEFQDTRYDAQRQADLTRYDTENQFNLNRYDTLNREAANRWIQQQQAEEGRLDTRVGQQQAQNRAEEGRLDTRLAQELQNQQTQQGRLDSRLGQQLQNQQFQQGRFDTQRTNDRSLYSSLAQSLLNAAVERGSKPEDYFKYNQMLSGGKDIVQQLFGDQPTADWSGFTGGEPQAGRVTDILDRLGLPQIPGGSVGAGSADAEQAFLARQGISPMGDAAFFGPQAANRDRAFLLEQGVSPQGDASFFGPQAAARDQRFLGANGYDPTPLFGPAADARESQWMGQRGPGAPPTVGPEPYTPRPDLPFMPAQTDYRVGATQAVPRLKAGYESLLKQRGVDHLGVDDPQLIDLYKSVTGLDDAGARVVARQAADYYTSTNGQVIPDGVLAGLIAQEHAVQRNTDPAQRTAASMVQAYVRQLQGTGQAAMTADDPRLQAIYRDIGGLDPEAALDAARRSAAFYNAGQAPATGSDLVAIMQQARNRAQPSPAQLTAPRLGQPQRAPSPTAQRLVRTAQAAAQPAYASLGWKSPEGYDAVQDPTTGQRYYRTAAGQILDPQTGAQVTPRTPRPDALSGQGMGSGMGLATGDQSPDPYEYLQETRRRRGMAAVA